MDKKDYEKESILWSLFQDQGYEEKRKDGFEPFEFITPGMIISVLSLIISILAILK
mgnify:FL=1